MVVMFRSAHSAGPGGPKGLVGRVQYEAMGRSWPRPRRIEDGWMQYRGTGGHFYTGLFTLFGHMRIYGKATGASSGLIGTLGICLFRLSRTVDTCV